MNKMISTVRVMRAVGLLTSVRLFSNVLFTTANPTTSQDRIRGAIYGSLVADALTLGSHYEYDAANIKKAYGGTITEYMAPGEMMGGSTHGVGWGRRNYHPGQKKGDQTDYGLYVMLALEYFAEHHPAKGGDISFNKFLPLWADKFLSQTWGAWVCTQTRQAMGKYMQHKGSNYDSHFVRGLGGMSNAMGLRSPAALAVYNDVDSLVKASDELMFTHANVEALAGGEFFTRLAHKIVGREGSIASVDELMKVMENAVSEMHGTRKTFCSKQLEKGVAKYKEATNPDLPLYHEEFVDDLAATSMARLWDVGKTEPIKVGKASPTEGTMPTSIYLILKYFSLHSGSPGKAFAEGVRANVMIGGDNASRSIAVGMILGAITGTDGIFGGGNEYGESWKNGLNSYEQVTQWLSVMEQRKTGHTEL